MQKRNQYLSLILLLFFIILLFISGNTNNEDIAQDIQKGEKQSNIYVNDTQLNKEILDFDEFMEQLEEAIKEPVISEEKEEIVPSNQDLVLVSDYIPSIYVNLKYATKDNFTGTVIYDFTDAYLRYGTVKKLAAAQEELLAQGYSLKIWDAYRPVSAQFVLWDVYPDSTYVANPNIGSSSHSRGNAVDVTLVSLDGTKLVMPTEFDDFSTLANRDYSDVSQESATNALTLERIMTNNGFVGYSAEWWHYSDSNDYSVVVE